jgi:NAD(P)-dependent dehydrogenase (short-subunit alcohol dehydrogenase family)
MTFAPDRLLATLAGHGVDFVVIGGLAATIHGSTLVTFDVDVTPRRSRDNLARLSEALTELGARIREDAGGPGLLFNHAGSLADAQMWNLTTDAGDLDLTFVPAGTRGFQDLARDAMRVDIAGVTLLVASLADVIRSKEAAGREKDRAALPLLRKLLSELTDPG